MRWVEDTPPVHLRALGIIISIKNNRYHSYSIDYTNINTNDEDLSLMLQRSAKRSHSGRHDVEIDLRECERRRRALGRRPSHRPLARIWAPFPIVTLRAVESRSGFGPRLPNRWPSPAISMPGRPPQLPWIRKAMAIGPRTCPAPQSGASTSLCLRP